MIREQELPSNLHDLAACIWIEDITFTDDVSTITSKIMSGYAAIQMYEDDHYFALIDLSDATRGLRTDNDTENEFSVVGPKVGFVEDLDINLHLIRQQIRTLTS